MTKRLLILSILLSTYTSFSQKGRGVDSLKSRIEQTDDISELIDLNVSIFKYLQRSNLSESKKYLDRASYLAAEQGSDSLNAFVNKNRAEYYLLSNRYDSVSYFFDRTLEAKQYLSPNDLIDLYSMRGTTYYYQSEYSKAITTHLEAEKIADKYNNEIGKARVYNNIAISYIKIENWEGAENYLNQSLDICEKYENKRGQSYNLGNLGIVYKNTNQFDRAIATYVKAVEISKALNDQHAIARNYDNIGALYELLKNYDLALAYYQKSFQIAKSIDNISIMANTIHNLGSIYNKKRNYSKALDNYNKSLSIAESLNDKLLMKNNYKGLSESAEQMGKLQASLKYRKLFEIYNDSVLNENHLKAIEELNIKYETEKKEKAIIALSSEQVKNETTLLKQKSKIRLLTIFLLSGFFVASTILIVARHRANTLKQKDIIKAITETQMGERKRIAQDLHDSVGGLLAITKSSLENINHGDEAINNEIEKSIALLSSSSEQVRKISHNLMPSELIKFGIVTAIESYLHRLDGSDISVHFYPHNMDVKLDDVKQLNVFRIFQEIVQNVLKHAKASEMNVYLNNHGKYIDLMVEDNGIGIDKAILKEHGGMGLKSMEFRVELLGGSMNVDSFNGKGTTINVKIPI